jgi:hypothetical protein
MRLVRLFQLGGRSRASRKIMGIVFRTEARTVSPGNVDQGIARSSSRRRSHIGPWGITGNPEVILKCL